MAWLRACSSLTATQSDLELLGLEHLQNASARGLIEELGLNAYAGVQTNRVLMARATFVDGINSSVALVARGEPAAAPTRLCFKLPQSSPRRLRASADAGPSSFWEDRGLAA